MFHLIGILSGVIFPILIIALSGYLIQKLFSFDLSVFTKVIFYLLAPCLIFSRIYQSTLLIRDLGMVALFVAGIICIMGLISFPLSWVRDYRAPLRAACALAMMFYNSGNYGLPVIELFFKQDPFATSIQVMVLATQNILTYTLGIFLVLKGQTGYRESIKRTLKLPMIYAVIVAILLKNFRIPIWQPIWIPIETMASALVPIALITLGAQLANIRLTRRVVDVVLTVLGRLLIGPFIAFCLLKIFQFSDLMARVLIISSGMPTAVNTVILATEYKNEPQFASEVVLFSTLLSIVTVSFVIYIATVWVG